jgi:hypothetical protein
MMDRRSFLGASAGVLAYAAWRPRRLPGLEVEGGAGLDAEYAAGQVGAGVDAAYAGAQAARSGAEAQVTMDPRIELFNVILYLGEFRGFAGNSPLTRLSSPYLDAVAARFGAFRGHPAVRRYEAMAERGFWLAHPPSALLHLTDPPQLAERIPVNDFTVRMAGGRGALDAFLVDVRRFAEDTAFMTWFEEQAPHHARLVAGYHRRLEWNYVQDLVDYYGDRRESYTVILAPLGHHGGFGPRVVRPDGLYDAYAVIGPGSVEDGMPDFGSGRAVRYLFWHEFSHAHVNHLTDRHLQHFMGAASVLQGHLRAEVEEHVPWEVHVSDWVSEHVVRGVTTRLSHLKVGAAEAETMLSREVQRFPHVGEVCHRLVEYEQNRRRYPTLESFYPRIVDVFHRIAAGAVAAGSAERTRQAAAVEPVHGAAARAPA